MNPGHTRFALWGGVAEVWCDDGTRIDEALAAVDAVVVDVDRACSTFRPDSDISRVNAAAGEAVAVGATLRQALHAALRCAAATDGLCDPTVGAATGSAPDDPIVLDLATGARIVTFAPRPRSAGTWRDVEIDDARGTVRVPLGVALDLNATAKAWAADLAASLAAQAAGCAVLVNLCGDLAVGGPPTEEPWLVIVADDHRPEQADEDGPALPGGRVMVRDGGLATSSTTVRRRPVAGGSDTVAHVVDPRTWLPLQGQWRTASVAAGTCLDANAAATAALVLADRAPQWLRRAGLPARLVAQDGTVELIGGWPQ